MDKGLVHPGYSMNGKKGPEFENYIVHRMSNNISDLVSSLKKYIFAFFGIKKSKTLKKIF